MVAAGTMRERIRVEVPITTTNEFGEAEQTWQCVRECSASIVQLTVNQLARANKPENQSTYNVTVRWSDCVTSLPMRVIWENNKCRTMYVSSAVADDPKRTNIVLTCEERED
jgi:SPP1 family predicted phage head-tail adaptor